MYWESRGPESTRRAFLGVPLRRRVPPSPEQVAEMTERQLRDLIEDGWPLHLEQAIFARARQIGEAKKAERDAALRRANEVRVKGAMSIARKRNTRKGNK